MVGTRVARLADSTARRGNFGGTTDLQVQTEGMRIQAFPSEEGASAVATWLPQNLPFLPRPSVRSPGPDPRLLIPLQSSSSSDEGAAICGALDRAAAACCWSELASDVHVEDARASLEYFGLQRQSWTLDAVGPVLTQSEAAAVYELWRSCLVNDNPDRILAVRQIISLFREPPWNKASDIDRASEPLYVAMRSDASAEGLRTLREAWALAMSVARETAESTSALTKSTLERSIAALASIAAIIVTRSTKTLTLSQATNLRHLLGIGLFALVPWSFFIEGRSLTQGIESFKVDLPQFSELLTEKDCRDILSAQTYTRVSSHAWLVRIVVPLVYLGLGAMAFFLT